MRDWLGLLALGAVALVGCSGPLAGSSPATGAGSVEPSAPALPPRPEVVDLAGVDPCSLLTEQQQQRLGIDNAPDLTRDPDRFGNRSCDYSKIQFEPSYGYQFTAITQEDVSVYLTGERMVTTEVVSVAGFPAVTFRRPTDDRGCFVGVSTKQGQYLMVQYGESSGIDESPAVVCEKARVAAAMATRTLLARR